MNPATRNALETNASFEEMLSDPDFGEEAAEAFRNPSSMREILESTDRAVKEIMSLPGGVELITQMHSQLNLPPETEELLNAGEKMAKKAALKEKKLADEAAGLEHHDGVNPNNGLEEGDPSESEEEMKNPNSPSAIFSQLYGPQINPETGALQAPKWFTAVDPNAVASMMQDPNLQQLMASYMETTERNNECFGKGAFLASLFRPENMTAIASMEQAINAMSAPRKRAEQERKSKEAAMRGGDSKARVDVATLMKTPASQFSKSFDTFLEAQKENPETRYRIQLTKMRHMGFTNTQKCIAALQEVHGNTQHAIDLMLRMQSVAMS